LVALALSFVACTDKLSISLRASFSIAIMNQFVSSTVTPLVFSGIFYASNGRYHIPYIDAFFNCFSSMCVCGLATVNLSSLTGWQQAILFIQMCIGNTVSRLFCCWVIGPVGLTGTLFRCLSPGLWFSSGGQCSLRSTKESLTNLYQPV
jgi:hypothetical protein